MHFILATVILLLNICEHVVCNVLCPETIHAEHYLTQYDPTLRRDIRARLYQQPLPAKNTQGRTFDRFVQIWLWDQDYNTASKDPSLQLMAKHGITLTNYHAISHTPLQNYIGSVGGQLYEKAIAKIDDGEMDIPEDRKTIADLMEAKNITWVTYEKHNVRSGRDEKELPFGTFKSYTNHYTEHHKQSWEHDFFWTLNDNRLPQWIFMDLDFFAYHNQPNRMDLGGVSTWYFLERMWEIPQFWNRTLVLITFNKSRFRHDDNRVFTILVGDALSKSDKGRIDNTYYNHYSIMATVERNWDLGDLGLNDRKAKSFF